MRSKSGSRKHKVVHSRGRTQRVAVHQHRRKSYSRKSYVRRDGTRVSASRVSAKTIEVRGVGRSRVRLPTPKRGFLTGFGYHTADAAAKRHAALDRAVRAKQYAEVVHHLNEIAILQKNSNPDVSKKIRDDMAYLKATR